MVDGYLDMFRLGSWHTKRPCFYLPIWDSLEYLWQLISFGPSIVVHSNSNLQLCKWQLHSINHRNFPYYFIKIGIVPCFFFIFIHALNSITVPVLPIRLCWWYFINKNFLLNQQNTFMFIHCSLYRKKKNSIQFD